MSGFHPATLMDPWPSLLLLQSLLFLLMDEALLLPTGTLNPPDSRVGAGLISAPASQRFCSSAPQCTHRLQRLTQPAQSPARERFHPGAQSCPGSLTIYDSGAGISVVHRASLELGRKLS